MDGTTDSFLNREGCAEIAFLVHQQLIIHKSKKMLNKKQKTDIMQVIAYLKALVNDEPLPALPSPSNAAEKAAPIEQDEFYRMSGTRRAFYNALLSHYGEKEIKVKGNEFLRKTAFDNHITSVGLTIQSFEEKGLAVRNLSGAGGNTLISFLLVKSKNHGK